jgi:hypothetical protein
MKRTGALNNIFKRKKIFKESLKKKPISSIRQKKKNLKSL